eukprot:CAMPEP_0196752674 /NCGR_PEP_ID=MMETSP1091-20130531/87879_1 /TAXON_ID=302021 /ORGANISM="Rhodomonas sp., Strain CCMP768" /LENGTH=131 /DNA_ID=CAMNT_0042100661 /DNA_START=1 /DNA_END=393 /DNA_ORIENTATION=-
MVLHDVYIPRNMRDQGKPEYDGSDEEYCDGWSEKIFSDEHSAVKVEEWMDAIPTPVGGWDDSMEFPNSFDAEAATDETPASPSMVLARFDADEKSSPQIDPISLQVSKPPAIQLSPHAFTSQPPAQRTPPP